MSGVKVVDKEVKSAVDVVFCFSMEKDKINILSGRRKIREEYPKLLKRRNFKAGNAETIFLDNIIFVGLGDKQSYLSRFIRKSANSSLSFAKSLRIDKLAYDCRQLDNASLYNLMISLHVLMHKITDFKSSSEHKDDKKVSVYAVCDKMRKPITAKAARIASAINYVRDIDNPPANIATPQFMANEAKLLSKKYGLKYTLITKKMMKKMGMNALLAVSYGSARDPVLPIIEYSPKQKPARKTIVVVGKGITFDSGGISLKPSKAMDEMKFDKSGACAVLGIMKAVASLKPNVRVVGLLPCTENMPGGNATKPGDIVKAYNGKTIEILNTDAEGRLILADALAYAEKHYKPDYIIDLATLTGACVIALGSYAMGMLSNDDDTAEMFLEASRQSFDEVWQLPLWLEYKEMMKSKIADIKNISGTHEAGTITAAAFLSNFISKSKWVHLDIAGTAWRTNSIPPIQFGATGSGVSAVVEFITRISGSRNA